MRVAPAPSVYEDAFPQQPVDIYIIIYHTHALRPYLRYLRQHHRLISCGGGSAHLGHKARLSPGSCPVHGMARGSMPMAVSTPLTPNFHVSPGSYFCPLFRASPKHLQSLSLLHINKLRTVFIQYHAPSSCHND